MIREREGAGATTNAIAAALQVTPASVTGMIKKLAEMKLVRHTPYQGVELTKVRREDRIGDRAPSSAAGTVPVRSAGLFVG